MDREEIEKMRVAYQEVQEGKKKKLDPVDKDELKGDHEDRDDKDIDNDGDTDDADEYLHNRRKSIKKAIKKEEVELDEKMSEAQKEKREEIVKSLKDKEAEFKEKYGERWKEVMYATATKMAMKEEVMEESNQNPNAADAEKMDDRLTACDKKFADVHGGIDPKVPAVDGYKAAEDTADNIKKSKPSKVAEAKTFPELMRALMEK